MKQAIFTFLFLICVLELVAQDGHYSQQYNTPTLINPALTNFTNCGGRISAQGRSQWASVAEPFQTMSFTYEQGFLQESTVLNGSFFGVGLTLHGDEAGNAILRNAQAQLSLAYHQIVSENSYLSFGVQSGMVSNWVKTTFVYDNQFNGRFFDPTLPSGEVVPEGNITYLDMSAGLAFSYKAANSSVNFGAAAFHLNQPNTSFIGNSQQTLNTRLVFHGNFDFALNDAFSFVGRAVFSSQGSSGQTLLGALVRYDLSAGSRFTSDGSAYLSAGAYFRLNDAVIGVVKLQWNRLGLGLSYDANLSTLITASDSYGGLELALSYTFGECYQSLNCPTF